MIAYIALGTNIEPREEYLNKSLVKLSEWIEIGVSRKSSVFETAPVGITDQADFLNMVAEVDTTLSPTELMDACLSIEKALGRKRATRNGPRTIDLDILVYNQEHRESSYLTLPHPRLHERAFVLVPLNEIAPDLVIPDSGARVQDLLKNLPAAEKEGVSKWV